MNSIRLAAVVAPFLMLASAPAAAQSAPADAAAGLAASKRWCADCHVVAPDQSGRGMDGAPSWASIARDPATTPAGLRQFLLAPHRGMPNLQLSRQDIDDIVAHIVTLGPSGR